MTSDADQRKDALRVIAAQGDTLNRELGKAKADAAIADEAIREAEALIPSPRSNSASAKSKRAGADSCLAAATAHMGRNCK